MPIWITYATLGLAGCACAGCLILFYSLHREIASAERRSLADRSASRASLVGIEEKLQRFEAEVCRSAGIAVTPPAPYAMSMNINRRARALRLLREGETPSHVSASLQLPRAEVELLCKVEGINAA